MNGYIIKEPCVSFNEDVHEYRADNGIILSGVTPIVAWVYPDTYKNIPAYILDKAKDRGTEVHKAIENFDNTNGMISSDLPEMADYKEIINKEKLKSIGNEILVSDNVNIASKIDVIFVKGRNKKHVIIADIKTTSSIHDKNVSLQLSIYAFLFVLNNPEYVVDDIAVIWLPKPQYGKARLKNEILISYDLCKEAVECYLNKNDSTSIRNRIDQLYFGGQCEKVGKSSDLESLPTELLDIQDKIIEIDKIINDGKNKEKELKDGLLQQMQKFNVKKWTSDKLVITRCLSTERITVDSKKLKESYPDAYNACTKTSTASESIKIKIKGE